MGSPDDFVWCMKERHEKNIEKWGEQGPLVLMIALTEEVGEVARAVLEYMADPTTERETQVQYECVDAAAVLMALAGEVERARKEADGERDTEN